jgi:hypothetical protein
MYRFNKWVAVVICAAALSCASEPRDRHLVSFDPRGPGAVFPSIETAAVDALAYAYKSGLDARTADKTRGGTIMRVRGGFAYGELSEAHELAPMHLTYSLGRRDVAHFRVYPRTRDQRQNGQNERVSRTDRNIVDARDPGHRPLFVLTPKLMIRAYRGEAVGTEAVADLGASNWSETLAISNH